MNQGDAFLIDQAAVGNHLWTIISDPAQDPERVLMVNVTSWTTRGDPSCILNPGDHPFIKQKSYIYYAAARDVKHEYLVSGCARNWMKQQESLSAALLERVLDGAELSPFLKVAYKELLVKQQIISG